MPHKKEVSMARHYNYRYELIKARKRSGLTQREVADKTFYSQQTITAAEKGKLYLNDESEASQRFFMSMENLYGIPREILRKRGLK